MKRRLASNEPPIPLMPPQILDFVILLPFLLIELVVASILLSLGMMMVPPATISLPIKLLMFGVIDGWALIIQGVTGSFR